MLSVYRIYAAVRSKLYVCTEISKQSEMLRFATATFCRLKRPVLEQRRLKHFFASMASGKLTSPSFKALLTPDLLFLESIFRRGGYGFRLVGGIVRDLLLDQRPKDVDIATECRPEVVLKLLEASGIRVIPTGLQHGTVTAHLNSKDYEITTLRIDRVTDGRHAQVEFTEDWREDAERRDLTINAMSLDLQGNLYDYFNGQQHLSEKKVVFVGDSRKRICEDFLRILRYFRFYGRIAPSPDLHDPATLEAIRETAEGLTLISVERVWREMGRILVGNHAPHLLRTMYSLQVASHIGEQRERVESDNVFSPGLPEEGDLEEFERVWLAMRAREGATLHPVSLLMSLVSSPEEAHLLTHQWKLSNSERKLGVFIVEHRAMGYREDLQLKSCQDLLVDGVPCNTVVELLLYCSRVELVRELEQWEVPKFPVNGKDLLSVGYQRGPQLGKMLRELQTRWKDSYFTLSKDDLLETALKEIHGQ